MSTDVQIKLLVKNVAAVQKQLTQVSNRLSNMGRQAQQSSRATATAAKGMTSALERTTRSALSLTRAFIGFQIGAHALRLITDEISRLQKVTLQLDSVSETAKDLADNLELVYSVSVRTGTSFSDTATNLVRFTRALQRFGGDANDAAVVLDTLNKAFLLTGATGAEATSVLTQMSQALTKGELSGDEFRSFAENAGILVDELAKTMGVSVTKLKELGAEGKITGDKIVETAIRVNDEFTRMFEATGELPLDRALTNVRSGLEYLLISTPEVSEVFGVLGGIVQELGGIFLQILTEILQVDSGFNDMTKTVLGISGPLQFAGRAIVGLVKTIYTLVKAVKFVADVVFNSFKFMAQIAGTLAGAFRTHLGAVGDLLIGVFTFDLEKIKSALARATSNVATTFDTFNQIGKEYLASNSKDFAELIDDTVAMWVDGGRKIAQKPLIASGNIAAPPVVQELKNATKAADKLADELQRVKDYLYRTFASLTNAPARALLEFEALNDEIERYIEISERLGKPIDLGLVEGLRKLNIQDYNRKIEDMNREWEDASEYLDVAGESARAFSRALEDIKRKGEDLGKTEEEITRAQDNYVRFVKSLREAEMLESIRGRIEELFGAIAEGSNAVIDVIKNMIAELITAIAYAAILEKMSKGTGSFGKTLGDLLTGGSGAASPAGRTGTTSIRIMNFSGGAVTMHKNRNKNEIDIVINALAGKIASGGSPLDKALSVGYGLSRRGV